MEDHGSGEGSGSRSSSPSTEYNTADEGEESDTDKPTTIHASSPIVSTSLAANSRNSTPIISVTATTGVTNEITSGTISPSQPIKAASPALISSLTSPGPNHIAGRSFGRSSNPSGRSANTSSGYHDSPPRRRNCHSLNPPKGTSGARQDPPVEKETDSNSRPKLIPDKPLSSYSPRLEQNHTLPREPSRPPSHNHSPSYTHSPSPIPIEPGAIYPRDRAPGRRRQNRETRIESAREGDRKYRGPESPRHGSGHSSTHGETHKDGGGHRSGSGYIGDSRAKDRMSITYDSQSVRERPLQDSMMEEGRLSRQSFRVLDGQAIPTRIDLIRPTKGLSGITTKYPSVGSIFQPGLPTISLLENSLLREQLGAG